VDAVARWLGGAVCSRVSFLACQASCAVQDMLLRAESPAPSDWIPLRITFASRRVRLAPARHISQGTAPQQPASIVDYSNLSFN